MKRSLVFLLALLLAVMIPFAGMADSASAVDSSAALTFSTTTLAGKKIDSSILQKYDLIMLDYWAEWCGPCVWEIPFLQQIYKNYSNVLVIGVYVGNDPAAGKSTANNLGVTYPIVQNNYAFSRYLITNGSSYSIPQAAFFDKKGNQLGKTEVGAVDYSTWATKVDSLLASLPKTDPEPAVTAPAISVQPKSATVKAGKTAKFTVKAAGDDLTYQWYYRTSSGGEWIKVAKKGTSAACSVKVTAKMNGWQFRCLVKNSAGEVYTKTVKLKVKK